MANQNAASYQFVRGKCTVKQLGLLLMTLFLINKVCAAQTEISDYEKALKLYNKGQFSEAEIVVKNSLLDHPNYLPARLLLGQALLKQGKLAAAEKELTLSANLRADSHIVVLPLVETKLLLNKPSDAIVLFEQFPSLSRTLQYYLLQGNTLKALNQFEQAEISYHSALAIEPNDTATLTALADLFYRQEHYQHALQELDKAIQSNAFYTPALLLKAEILKQEKKFQDAALQYTTILAKHPNNHQALFGQASVFLAQEQLEDAILLSTKLRELAPNDPYAKLLHSSLLTLQGNTIQGKQMLADIQQQILNLSDKQRNEKEVLLLSGSVDFINQNFQQARIKLQRYIQMYGEHIIVRRHLANIALRENDIRQAELHITKALDIDADEIEVQLLASLIFKQTRSSSEYLSYVAGMFQTHKENELIKDQYISALIEAGQYEQAKALLTQGQNNLANQTLLGFVLLQQGQLKQAGKISQELLNRYPNKIEVLQLAGELSLKLGRRDDAISIFKQAIVLDEKFRPALLALAGIALNDNNLKKAESYYQHILNFYPDDPDVLQLYAKLAIDKKQPELAIKLLTGLPTTILLNKQTQTALLSLYLSTNQLELAQQAADRLKSIDPFNQEYLLARSQMEHRLGHQEKAQKTLKVLFGLVYDEVAKLEKVASLQLNFGDAQAAAKTIERAADISGTVNAFLAARLALIRENYDAVDQAVAEALRSEKSLPWLELQVYSLMAQNKSETALPLLEALYSDSPTRHHLQLLAQLYATLSKQEPLKQLLADWLVANPTDTWATAQLSSLYEKTSNQRAAIKLLESYPNLNRQPLFLNNLANLYREIDTKKALSLANRAYRLLPDFAPINDTLGWMLVRQGKYEQGLSYLREATTRDSNNATYFYHLAITLAKLGRMEEAQQTAIIAKQLKVDHKLLGELTELLSN